MENNKDAKDDFLRKAVVNESSSVNHDGSFDEPKQKSSQENKNKPKSNSKLWRNLFIFSLVILVFYFIFQNLNKDKKYYYEESEKYFSKGDIDNGMDYLNEAIELDPEYVDALILRGEKFIYLDDYSSAISDFNDVINLDQSNWEAYYFRAVSYMNNANNKYSPYYENAINDFSTSITLNSDTSNSKSHILRGDCKEIYSGEYTGCNDYSIACQNRNSEGCAKYNKLCYPETGFMPYKKYFGEGVHSGNRSLDLDNSQSTTDALVVLQNAKTGIKVRSQFIRKGDKLTMSNIPKGYYKLKTFHGNTWTFDAIMPDGITKGGFTKDIELEQNTFDFILYESWKLTLYKVIGGTAESQEIDFNEFMK